MRGDEAAESLLAGLDALLDLGGLLFQELTGHACIVDVERASAGKKDLDVRVDEIDGDLRRRRLRRDRDDAVAGEVERHAGTLQLHQCTSLGTFDLRLSPDEAEIAALERRCVIDVVGVLGEVPE